jgi:uncharacterized repeat protein (TIGR02543 family)
MNAGAGGSTVGAGTFTYGTSASIAAVPDTGYHFVNWTGSSVTEAGSSSTTVTMTADRNVTANFAIDTFALTMTAGAGGSTAGSGIYAYGTSASIAAAPATGYHFVNWTGDGVTDSSASSTTVTMDQNRTVSANFAINQYTLILTGGAGGTLTGSGSYSHGTNPSISVVASPGYHFVNWSGVGIADLNATTTTVDMTQDRNVTANFNAGPMVANELFDMAVNEDAVPTSIDLANVFNDLDDDNASITKTATSSDPSLVTVSVSGDLLTLYYQANQTGDANVTVTATSNGQTVEDSFEVTVTEANDPPVVANALGDVTATEDDPDSSIDLSNVFNDVDNDNASIVKVASSDNPAVVTGSVSGDLLTLDYQADQHGIAVITVVGISNAQDVNDTFTVIVSPVDDGPVLANELFDLSVNEDAADTSIDLGNVFNDLDDDNASITKTATSSDPLLVEAIVEGDLLTLHYHGDQHGTAVITVVGNSNGQDVNDTISVIVAPVNDAPAFAEDNATLSVPENSFFSFFALATDADGDLVTSFVSGPDSGLFHLNSVTGELTLDQPFDFENPIDADANGIYHLTVNASDGTTSSSQSITLTVTDVFENLAPIDIMMPANFILENQPVGSLVGTLLAVDPDDPNGAGSYVFEFVDGNGSLNDQFTLDANGTVRTAVVFDYEALNGNVSLPIRAEVRDEHNASFVRSGYVFIHNEVEDLDGDGVEDHYDWDDDGDGFSDDEELAAGTDPANPQSIPNHAPEELFLDNQFVD